MWDGSSLQLEWTSSSPPGTIFQVYVARALVWHGTDRWVAIPMPSCRVRIDIGAVAPGEAGVDFSASLPGSPGDRARLSWLGGTYLDPAGNDDVAGFRVFGERTPGGGIDLSTPAAEIRAYPGGVLTDGFGQGGFGQGGFGRAASTYGWTSPSLGSGTWSFAVASFDAAGNQGTPTLTSITINAPPRPPAPYPDGKRLRSSYDPKTRTVTLTWQPSPSC